MTIKLYLASLLMLAGLHARSQNTKTAMETSNQTLTCKLTTPEQQKRKATVIAELKAKVLTRTELSNGYGYGFESTDEILDKLHAFIKTERLCCDFFIFQLTVDGNKALLNITGPEDAKQFLKDEVDL